MKPTRRRVAILCGYLLCVAGCRAQINNAATLPAATERESIPGTDISYADAAVDNGDRVLLIVTWPQGMHEPLPVALLVGWLCKR